MPTNEEEAAVARRRNPRVDKQVRAAIADLIEGHVSDPRVSFVTITEADVTPDHEVATIYYSTLDPSVVAGGGRRGAGDQIPAAEQVAEGLEAATGRLRGMLARRVGLRVTPQLRFVPDPVVEHASRVDELLRGIEVRDVPPGTGGVEDLDDDGGVR